MKKSFTESDLMEFVRTDFEQLGYTTYAEVCLSGGGSIRCDLFGINYQTNHSIVFEAKLTFNLKVIQQAYDWHQKANAAYIIVPKVYRQVKTIKLARKICEFLGIGVIEVDMKKRTYDITVKSKNIDNPKLPTLYEQQRSSISSNNTSSYVTPFKITVINLDQYMSDKDNVYINDIIKNIKHHYKTDNSAINAIKNLIKDGVIKNYSLIKLNNKVFLNKI